jgi:hypothetical protein
MTVDAASSAARSALIQHVPTGCATDDPVQRSHAIARAGTLGP